MNGLTYGDGSCRATALAGGFRGAVAGCTGSGCCACDGLGAGGGGGEGEGDADGGAGFLGEREGC